MFRRERPDSQGQRHKSKQTPSLRLDNCFPGTRKQAWEGQRRGRALGWYLFCLILCFPILLAGQKPQTVETQVESQTAVEQGQALFRSSCAFCHGLDGKGANGPDLVRSPLVSHDVNGDLIGQVIRNGRVDKGMPSFAAMKPEQMSQIAAFLHHQARVALHSSRLQGDYSLTRMMTGNVLAGKAFFDGAGGCAQCHSVTGDLAGIAKKYQPLELQRKMIYPNSMSVSKTAVVTLKNGQRCEGKLVDQDEFDIGVICQDGWYRSWRREEVQLEIHDPLEAHRQLLSQYTDADLHNVFAYLETLK
jgi:cytochrome c oxidase cbb3-type subunit III